MSGKPRVVVTRKIPAPVEEELTRLFDVQLNPDDRPLDAAGLQEALRTADGLLPTVTDKLTAEVLAAEPLKAKVIATFGVGFNNIDIAAAKARGLMVTNTPDVLTDDTADIATILLLTVARRAGEGERHVRAKAWTGWRPTHMLGTKVSGKTLGLIGMGRIAKAVAKRAHHGFGMRIIYHDPYPPKPEEAKALGAEGRDSIEGGPAGSRFRSRIVPRHGDPPSHQRRLKLMKRGAFLINTARGGLWWTRPMPRRSNRDHRRRGPRRL
jgi:lactate dehydrogenase-like 2-hydroxyacid dehydrogenase